MARRNRIGRVEQAKMTGPGTVSHRFVDRSPHPTRVDVTHGEHGASLILTMNPDGRFDLSFESAPIDGAYDRTPLMAGYVRDDHLEVHELPNPVVGEFAHDHGALVYDGPSSLGADVMVRGVKRIEFDHDERGEASRENWGQE